MICSKQTLQLVSWNSIRGNRHNWKATYIYCYLSWYFVKFKKQEFLPVMWRKCLLFYEQSPITLQQQKWKLPKSKDVIFSSIVKLYKNLWNLFKVKTSHHGLCVWMNNNILCLLCFWRSYLKNKMQKNRKCQLLKCSFVWFEKSLWYTSVHLVAYTNEHHMDYAYWPRSPWGSNFNITCIKIAKKK